jgi:2-keto-4-pentenoate hydratase/2-oxohepta-3-ene-1,7-dioic acid hydratase in catechol pathway
MKIICVGVNYKKHAAEMGRQLPSEPVIFLKPDSAILKNNKPFFLPGFSEEIHYEVEVVAKIGKLGKGIQAKYAYRYIDGFTVGIDITARDLQRKQGKAGMPWEIAKAFDGSAPIGKFVPASGFPNLQDIDFRLEINGTVVQESNTADMIFGFGEIIEYVSGFFTLKTGDLIFSGTPSGVGPLNKNDHLVAYLEEKAMLDFYIK